MTEMNVQITTTANTLNMCDCGAPGVFGTTPRTSSGTNKMSLTVALITQLRGFIFAVAGEVYPNAGDASPFREAELYVRNTKTA